MNHQVENKIKKIGEYDSRKKREIIEMYDVLPDYIKDRVAYRCNFGISDTHFYNYMRLLI